MNDKQIAALIMAHVLPAMQATSGLSGVKLARNYQSRMHGASSSPYVYFVKIGDRRYGSPARNDVWDAQLEAFTHSESQQYESTYQFSAWIPQDPTDLTGLTESDILNAVSGIIQSDSVLAAFRAQGVGIMRVSDIRNPYIVDDHDQFEAVPSFDVTLSHARSIVSTIPAVVTYDADMRRI